MSRPSLYSSPGNRLLAALAPADLALLNVDLEPMDLPVRHVLEQPGKTIDHVYFVGRGIASVVASSRNLKRNIEIGLIGREGMSGHAILMGNHQSPNATYMQVAGAGHRMPAKKLRAAVQASPALHGILLKTVQVFLTQTAQTAVANARSMIEERLARWILMAHDRVDADTLPLTHEFLSVMLGVRRAGVTIALQALEKRRLILSRRGAIAVIDRAGLEKIAGDAYGLPEAELKRLLGTPAPAPAQAGSLRAVR